MSIKTQQATVNIENKSLPFIGHTPFSRNIEIFDSRGRKIVVGSATHFLIFQKFKFHDPFNNQEIASAKLKDQKWAITVKDRVPVDDSLFAFCVALKQLEDDDLV